MENKGSECPTLVFLHHGLGSAASWRGLPAELADRLGARALVYSRAGHGDAAPRTAPRTPAFLHAAAHVELPERLRASRVAAPILVGHSDGASIALLYAARAADVRGVVAIAPHVFVEPKTIEAIARLRARCDRDGMPRGLRALHGDGAAGLVADWTRVWLSPAFRPWNIEREVARITCPVLLVQGDDDEYGTDAQLERVRAALGSRAGIVRIAGAGHVPHRSHPRLTTAAIESFVRSLPSLPTHTPQEA